MVQQDRILKTANTLQIRRLHPIHGGSEEIQVSEHNNATATVEIGIFCKLWLEWVQHVPVREHSGD
jgi:hypothetical protein